MSYNAVLARKVVGTVLHCGKQLTVSVATRTTDFVRPEEVAEAQGPEFTKALAEDTEPLPEKTAEAVLR